MTRIGRRNTDKKECNPNRSVSFLFKIGIKMDGEVGRCLKTEDILAPSLTARTNLATLQLYIKYKSANPSQILWITFNLQFRQFVFWFLRISVYPFDQYHPRCHILSICLHQHNWLFSYRKTFIEFRPQTKKKEVSSANYLPLIYNRINLFTPWLSGYPW